MDVSVFFLLLTLVLFVVVSLVLFFQPDQVFEHEKPDYPLLYVVGVQELREGGAGPTPGPASFPRIQDQHLVRKQLLVYGESVPSAAHAAPS